MNRYLFRILLSITSIFLLTACGMFKDEPVEQDTSSEEVPDYERIPSLVPVADYTGEEYELRDADPDMEISAEMEAEIETAVKGFFIENYKTEVKMNRYFHGDGYVRAVVESIGDPLFYTEVNVGLEKDGDTVIGVTGVGALEGHVEQAIGTGLAVMGREKEYEELDKIIENFIEEYPVTGVQTDVHKDVWGLPYATPYYFVTQIDPQIETNLKKYIEDEERDIQKWRTTFSAMEYDQELFVIAINLHMKNEGDQPDEEMIAELENRIEQAEGIPRGGYTLALHDFSIIGRVGFGEKENSIARRTLNLLYKE